MKIRFRRDGFPVEIPWPGEGEWTKHCMWDGGNRCCVSGWLFQAFIGSPLYRPADELQSILFHRYDHALAVRIRESSLAVMRRANTLACRRGFLSAIDFNNDPQTTDADSSAFWAELWGSFGYEECP